MKIYKTSPLDIVIIEDVFSEEQYDEILEELFFYVKEKILFDEKYTGSAKYDDGNLKKKNSSLFLDVLYPPEDRALSLILKHTENALLSDEFKENLQKQNILYGILKCANRHFTLVNYYENSDYYDYHFDESAFSTLSFFYKEPKSFSGGNIKFRVNDQEIDIEIKNNMSIVFPSFYEHRVVPISMQSTESNNPLGRFSIAQFIFVVN